MQLPAKRPAIEGTRRRSGHFAYSWSVRATFLKSAGPRRTSARSHVASRGWAVSKSPCSQPTGPGELPRQQVVEGITVLRVPAWPRGRDYYLAPGIATVIGQRGWDLVHCQGIHTPVPLLAMISARRAGIPYLITFHTGGHSSRLRNAMRTTQWRLAGPLLRNAVSLIAVSRFEAAALARHARLGDKRVIVIRNGGALPPPRPGTVAVPGRIVSSGRLERYKGHHRVIEALPHVVREIPEPTCGSWGPVRMSGNLHELAGHLGVSDRVSIEHVASADRQGMATALAEASVVAALSDYEAHPVAVMEALSVARPVVGYDIAGIGELIAEGWVRGVPPGAPAADVARQLVKAMSSPVASAPWIRRSCQPGTHALTSSHRSTCRLWASPPRAGPCEREIPPARLIAMAWGEATMAEARRARHGQIHPRNSAQGQHVVQIILIPILGDY